MGTTRDGAGTRTLDTPQRHPNMRYMSYFAVIMAQARLGAPMLTRFPQFGHQPWYSGRLDLYFWQLSVGFQADPCTVRMSIKPSFDPARHAGRIH